MRRLEEILPERPEKASAGAGSRTGKHFMMEEREAAIKLEDGSLIKGRINIFAEPAHENHDVYLKNSDYLGTYYKRISDIFTKGTHPFIVVYDAVVEGQKGRVLIINKNKILWVSPLD